MCFFIMEINEKGADLPKFSSYILGYAQATFTLTSMRKKSTSQTDMELFAYLFSRYENWAYSRYREQELKALCIFMSRESVVDHP